MQRANKSGEVPTSESFGSTVEHVKHLPTKTATRNADERKLQELERDNFDLKITNRAKEIVIERMQKERDVIIEKMLASSRVVGQLETKLHQMQKEPAGQLSPTGLTTEPTAVAN